MQGRDSSCAGDGVGRLHQNLLWQARVGSKSGSGAIDRRTNAPSSRCVELDSLCNCPVFACYHWRSGFGILWSRDSHCLAFMGPNQRLQLNGVCRDEPPIQYVISHLLFISLPIVSPPRKLDSALRILECRTAMHLFLARLAGALSAALSSPDIVVVCAKV